jgi:hypothetical protein
MLFEKRYYRQNPDNIPDNAQQTKLVRRSLFIDLDTIDDPSELLVKGEFDRYKAISKSFVVGSLVGNLLILTIDLSYLTIKFPKDDVLII